MFIAALLITDKTRKQPRGSLECKWTNNDVNKCSTTRQWNIYSALKTNELSSHKKNGGSLHIYIYISLGQSSQSGKATY